MKRRTVRQLARNDRRISKRIDVKAVPEQHWRFRIGGGAIQFETLTAEQATQRLAGASEAGFLGIPISWGDLWDAVEGGLSDLWYQAKSVLEATISVVADGISAAINLFIDGTQYVFNGIIETVEQAWDMISGVFAAVGSAFETLFDWLAFILNWTDILYTKDAIKAMINAVLAALPKVITWAQASFDTEIRQFEQTVTNKLNDLSARLAGQDLLSFSESAPEPTPGFHEATGQNVVFTYFANNVDQVSPPVSANASIDGDDPVTILIGQLQGIVQDFETGQAKEHLQQAITYFESLGTQLTTNPDAALMSGLAGMVQILASLAQLSLETVKSIIDAISKVLTALVQLVNAAITTPWPIPFVSPFYTYITTYNSSEPGQLTALDLGCLLLAVPSTLLYKIVKNKAPFASQTDVQAFADTFSAQAILDALGISSQPTALPSRGPSASEFSVIGLEFVEILNLLTTLGFTAAAIGADVQEVSLETFAPTSAEIGWSVAALVCELGAFASGAPFWSLTPPPNLDVIVWALGFTTVGCDITTFLANWKIAPLSGDFGVVISVLEGLEILALGGIWWSREPDPWPLRLAYLVTAFPYLSKVARLTAVQGQPPPFGEIALIALGAVDFVCFLPSAIVEFYYSSQALSSSSIDALFNKPTAGAPAAIA